MVSEEDARRIALSLPEVAERPYNRLPGFRVRGKLFARLHEQPGVLFLKCADLGEKEALITAHPAKFFTTPHYNGYPGVLVRLAAMAADELTEMVTESWRLCAPRRLVAAFDAEHPLPSSSGRPLGG